MRCGFFLALAVLFQTANCFPKYSSLDSNGYSSDYKSDPKCKYVDDIEYDEKCEPYTGEFELLKFSLSPINVKILFLCFYSLTFCFSDKVCYTHHEEKCNEIVDKTCRPFVYKSQTRKCFNVTETVCTLKEEVTYEVIDAIFTVQKCNRASGK